MMVWRGVIYHQMDSLVPTLSMKQSTGSTYRQMLVDYASPQLQGKRLHFQHDGAASHYAVVVLE